MKIARSSDKSVTFIRALVHGDSGIGKTTSLLTLDPKRTLVAFAERNVVPLRNADFLVAPMQSWDDVRDVVRTIGKSPCVLEDRTIDIVVFDSISAISELCKKQIVEVDRKALIKDRTKGKSDTPTGVYDDLMTMEDYNLYNNRMKGLLTTIMQLSMHVIFTSLSEWKEDQKTGQQWRRPNLAGKLGVEVPAYFDLVLYMDTVKGEDGKPVRCWRTQNDGRVIAKDASGALSELEAPNWRAIFNKILAPATSRKGAAATKESKAAPIETIEAPEQSPETADATA